MSVSKDTDARLTGRSDSALQTDPSPLRPLGLRVTVGVHETAISVQARLAVRNGYKSSRELLNHVPNLVHRTRYAMEHNIEIAAALNGTCAKQLAESSPVRIGSILRIGRHQVFSGRGPIQGRVCPACLEADARERVGDVEIRPYARDWWQIAHITCCPSHLVRLTGVCRRCNEVLDMRRPRVAFCSCGNDLRDDERETIEEDAAASDRFLLGLLGRGPIESVRLLDDLSFNSASGIMLAVGVGATGDITPERSWNPGPDRGKIASRGLEFLRGGWSSYDAVLSNLLNRSSRRAQSLNPYGYLQRWLTADYSEDLAPFRARIIEHASRHRAATPSKPLLHAKIEDSRWITMLSAQRIVGRTSGLLYRALEKLGMSEHATGANREAAITREAVDRLVAFFGEALIRPEAMAHLGFRRDQFDHMVAQGRLSSCLPSDRTSGSFYHLADLDTFASAVRGIAHAVPSAPPEMISLGRADRMLAQGKFTSLRALVDGRLRASAVVLNQNSHWSLGGLLISKADVLRLRMSFYNGVTREQLAMAMSTHRLAIGMLARAQGYRWPRGIVPIADARELQQRFVSAAEIDATYPKLGGPAASAALLKRQNILPVIRAACRPMIYHRLEAERCVGLLPFIPLEA